MLNRVAGFNLDDMILLNQLQIKKRKGLFDESDTEKLNSIMSTDYHVLFGKIVLQEMRAKAEEQFNLFSEEEKEQYMTYPIFKYFVQMQKFLKNRLSKRKNTVIHARYFSANQRKKALSGDHAW